MTAGKFRVQDENRHRGGGMHRHAELAEILAAGLMRLWAQQSNQIPALNAENSLDISVAESGHPTPAQGRMADG